jgi:hypothetical protein
MNISSQLPETLKEIHQHQEGGEFIFQLIVKEK